MLTTNHNKLTHKREEVHFEKGKYISIRISGNRGSDYRRTSTGDDSATTCTNYGETLAIGLVVTILGMKSGVLAVLLYILIGAVGMPVFSGMSGGLGILVGPTGGYIVGFLPTAFIMGLYLKKFGITIPHAIVANVIGMVITLAFGTTWLKIVADLTWTAAFIGGVAPFIIVGLLKAVLAAWLGVTVRRRLKTTQFIQATA